MNEQDTQKPAGTTIGNLQSAHADYEKGSDAAGKVVNFFKRVISFASEAHTRLSKIEAFLNPFMVEGAALSGNAKIEALEQRVITLETTLNKIAEGVQVGTQAAEADTGAGASA